MSYEVHISVTCDGLTTSEFSKLNRSQHRLQNSPYFCVFKYARAVKQKVAACEALTPRARKTLTPHFTDFFTDFEKKTDCFAVYSQK